MPALMPIAVCAALLPAAAGAAAPATVGFVAPHQWGTTTNALEGAYGLHVLQRLATQYNVANVTGVLREHGWNNSRVFQTLEELNGDGAAAVRRIIRSGTRVTVLVMPPHGTTRVLDAAARAHALRGFAWLTSDWFPSRLFRLGAGGEGAAKAALTHVEMRRMPLPPSGSAGGEGGWGGRGLEGMGAFSGASADCHRGAPTRRRQGAAPIPGVPSPSHRRHRAGDGQGLDFNTTSGERRVASYELRNYVDGRWRSVGRYTEILGIHNYVDGAVSQLPQTITWPGGSTDTPIDYVVPVVVGFLGKQPSVMGPYVLDMMERHLRSDPLFRANDVGNFSGLLYDNVGQDKSLVYEAIQQMTVEHASAVVGPRYSSVSLFTGPIIDAVSLPVLSGHADMFMRVVPHDAAQGAALAAFVLSQGWRHVNILCISDSYGAGVMKA
eukprot:gene5755-52061_t